MRTVDPMRNSPRRILSVVVLTCSVVAATISLPATRVAAASLPGNPYTQLSAETDQRQQQPVTTSRRIRRTSGSSCGQPQSEVDCLDRAQHDA